MKKILTDCCALCQLAGVHNGTTKEHFEYALEQLKKEKALNIEVGITHGNGQTAAFVIATPNEGELKKTLESVGFKSVHSFERRQGYVQNGLLEMYVKNF
jgi:hypothetical protein